jgi:Ni/Fe-hydrogenase 1 B-type cytochrome subunit
MAVVGETIKPAAPPAERVEEEPPGDITIPLRRQRVRVYTWQVPVRVTHWVTVGSVMVLALTGGYIGDPFLVPATPETMNTVRFIHFLTAFVFLASGIVRTYWLFAGNRFSNWRAFIPTSRRQLSEMGRQTAWYAFLRPDAPKVLGHNALAAGTYLVVFFLFLVMTVTGFALQATHGTAPWAALFGWVNGVFGISSVRFVHHLVMWVILAFMIHHVYSALLVDHWERNGLMSSIFSGNKFVTRQEIQEARDGGWDVQGIAE